MRYVMWIAEFSESSNLWTHLALFGIPKSMSVWVSWNSQPPHFVMKWVVGLDYGCLSASLPAQLKYTSNPVWKTDGLTRRNNYYRWGRLTFKSLVVLLMQIILRFRPQISQDYPLNLSISISGGKETNKDSPSNGEWSGKSSNLKAGAFGVRVVISRSVFRAGPCTSSLE